MTAHVQIATPTMGARLRILLIIAAVIVLIGGAVATIKTPNVRAQERVLARYKVNPDTTRASMRTAILKCVPGIAQSRVGPRFTGSVIVPLYVKLLHMRQSGTDRQAISAQMRKSIIKDHLKLLDGLPDKDFLEMVGYVKKMGEDDIENCILDTVSEGAPLNENTKQWGLRI